MTPGFASTAGSTLGVRIFVAEIPASASDAVAMNGPLIVLATRSDTYAG